MAKKRVVSAMRSSGELHLGHYFGAIKNWLNLQKEYDCFFFGADWHALTSDYKDPSKINRYALSNIKDCLSLGIDPERVTLFIQSHVKEHAELYLLLSMITPLGWLERNPTYKEQISQIQNKDLSNLGFFSYPVLQAADVLVYNGEIVPVGEDQVPHLELSREIARRFNFLYGDVLQTAVFKEPQAELTPTPKIPGIDGRKMSNSYGNAIFLSDPEKVVSEKVMKMMTDPARKRRQDPGEPKLCPLFDLHEVFTEASAQEELALGCRTAAIGCVDCKKELLKRLLPWHDDFLKKRADYESHPKRVHDIIKNGSEKARKEASKTMERVREAIHL